MTDGEWKKGRGGAVMIKVIVVDDERFVRMGIVGETDRPRWVARSSVRRKTG